MTFSDRAIEAAKAIDFAKESRDLKQALADNAYPAADGSADIDNHAIPIIEATLRNVAERFLTAALAVDGVALVPKEPTQAMIDEATGIAGGDGVPDEGYDEDIRRIWLAMLAAASVGHAPAPALQGWQQIESAHPCDPSHSMSFSQPPAASDREEAEVSDVDYDDGECPICGGEGFTFDCFDDCCADADIGCDDCTMLCSCQKRQASPELQEILRDALEQEDSPPPGTEG
jgi:hypothetical protein